MNNEIRLLNAPKSQKSHKKKRTLKKNYTVNLATNVKAPKSLIGSAKNSFVQEFRRIKKEISSELRKENLKFKAKAATACASPQNKSGIKMSPGEDRLNVGDANETGFKKKNIRKFIKKKRRENNREKLREKSQEIK